METDFASSRRQRESIATRQPGTAQGPPKLEGRRAKDFPPLPQMSCTSPLPAAQGHVAAIAVSPGGRIAGCDDAGQAFLARGDGLQAVDGRLCCADTQLQARLAAALREALANHRTSHLLLTGQQPPVRRFSLIVRHPDAAHAQDQPDPGHVLCLVTALDRRRIATARQLMDLFGLTAAEARLTRGLTLGESLEDFAQAQGLKMPTVRSQLAAIFRKTHTDRQALLVSLIAAIPVIRD